MTTEKSKQKWTAGDVEAAIGKKYAAPKYATFFNVPNATGSLVSRRADAVSMGLWPSEGLHLHGFEIKVHRSDWQKELQEPMKAFAISKFCHFWWVVAPAGVVKVEEMPEGWGLQEVSGSGLRVKKGAQPKESTETITPVFLAAILRKAQESSATTAMVKKSYDDGFAAGKAHAERRAGRNQFEHEVKSLREAIEKFQKSSGVQINCWNGGEIGEIVQAIRSGGLQRLPARLQTHAQQFEEIAKSCRVASDVLGECFERESQSESETAK